MKKQEKTQRTRERILSAALSEFGSNTYEHASINRICSVYQISKGLIYHNFSGKETLYLECVRHCYDKMTAYLESHMADLQNSSNPLHTFFMLRQAFFEENPNYSNIIFETVFQPPAPLAGRLPGIRTGYEALCTACCRDLLGRISLREGYTTDKVMSFFSLFLDFFNGHFQKPESERQDYQSLTELHEKNLTELFDILFYGIAVQPENTKREELER